jgi:predicted ArsR family transcriptional regulator
MSYEAASKTEYGPSNVAGAIVRPNVRGMNHNVRKELAKVPSGLTSDELAERLGISINYARPRVSELHSDGEVEDSGKRRKNANSRMSATVWRLTELGWSELKRIQQEG